MDNLRKFINKIYIFEDNLKIKLSRWFNRNIDWFYITLIILSVAACFKLGYILGKVVLQLG